MISKTLDLLTGRFGRSDNDEYGRHGAKDQAKDQDDHGWKGKDGRDEYSHGGKDKHGGKDDDDHGWKDKHGRKDDDDHGWKDKHGRKDDDDHGWKDKHGRKDDDHDHHGSKHGRKDDDDHGWKDKHDGKHDGKDGHHDDPYSHSGKFEHSQSQKFEYSYSGYGDNEPSFGRGDHDGHGDYGDDDMYSALASAPVDSVIDFAVGSLGADAAPVDLPMDTDLLG